MQHQPKTPYPLPLSSPFCTWVKFPQSRCPSPLQAFLRCLSLLYAQPFELSSPFCFFFFMRPSIFPPMSIFSLRMGWVPPNLIQAPLSVSSLHTSQVPPNSIFNPLLSPLCKWVEFPPTWFSISLLSPLYSWVEFPPNPILGLLFISSCT
jgi:hypothetical protein